MNQQEWPASELDSLLERIRKAEMRTSEAEKTIAKLAQSVDELTTTLELIQPVFVALSSASHSFQTTLLAQQVAAHTAARCDCAPEEFCPRCVPKGAKPKPQVVKVGLASAGTAALGVDGAPQPRSCRSCGLHPLEDRCTSGYCDPCLEEQFQRLDRDERDQT